MLRRIFTALRLRYVAWKDPIAYARLIGVRLGDNCRIVTPYGMFGSEPFLIKLGNRVTIASGAVFLTHEGSVYLFKDQYPDLDVVAPIIIEDDVFIGIDSIIFPGVRVGRNSIVGVRALVTKDVPPNSVVAGSPARVICSTDDFRERALKKAVPTARMTREQKKAYYLEKFTLD